MSDPVTLSGTQSGRTASIPVGIVESGEAFYETLLEKWKEYFHRLKSGCHLTGIIGHENAHCMVGANTYTADRQDLQ